LPAGPSRYFGKGKEVQGHWSRREEENPKNRLVHWQHVARGQKRPFTGSILTKEERGKTHFAGIIAGEREKRDLPRPIRALSKEKKKEKSQKERIMFTYINVIAERRGMVIHLQHSWGARCMAGERERANSFYILVEGGRGVALLSPLVP